MSLFESTNNICPMHHVANEPNMEYDRCCGYLYHTAYTLYGIGLRKTLASVQ